MFAFNSVDGKAATDIVQLVNGINVDVQQRLIWVQQYGLKVPLFTIGSDVQVSNNIKNECLLKWNLIINSCGTGSPYRQKSAYKIQTNATPS